MQATFHASPARPELVSEQCTKLRGFEVRARCFAIGGREEPRHEIVLESGQHRAVVDVPRGDDPKPLLARALAVFAESLPARR